MDAAIRGQQEADRTPARPRPNPTALANGARLVSNELPQHMPALVPETSGPFPDGRTTAARATGLELSMRTQGMTKLQNH